MNPNQMAELAKDAMLQQLATTPKPGLVDRESSGAHLDLNYPLMLDAIEALAPHIVTFGQTGLFLSDKTDAEVSDVMQKVGVSALQEVREVSQGANALKGTAFCLGLFVTAYYRVFRHHDGEVAVGNLIDQIARLAAPIKREKDSHGALVAESYQVEGALGEAQSGYRKWLTEGLWLYRKLPQEDRDVKMLLYIMARLDDSCVYHRVGGGLAEDVKTIAQHLYDHFDLADVRTACRYFERCHISTGGSGDILTLIILADKVLPKE